MLTARELTRQILTQNSLFPWLDGGDKISVMSTQSVTTGGHPDPAFGARIKARRCHAAHRPAIGLPSVAALNRPALPDGRQGDEKHDPDDGFPVLHAGSGQAPVAQSGMLRIFARQLLERLTSTSPVPLMPRLLRCRKSAGTLSRLPTSSLRASALSIASLCRHRATDPDLDSLQALGCAPAPDRCQPSTQESPAAPPLHCTAEMREGGPAGGAAAAGSRACTEEGSCWWNTGLGSNSFIGRKIQQKRLHETDKKRNYKDWCEERYS